MSSATPNPYTDLSVSFSGSKDPLAPKARRGTAGWSTSAATGLTCRYHRPRWLAHSQPWSEQTTIVNLSGPPVVFNQDDAVRRALGAAGAGSLTARAQLSGRCLTPLVWTHAD